jgi:hypothetical protein
MQPVSLALLKNQTSGVWEVSSGIVVVHVGGTFDGETVTVQMCPTSATGTYANYAVKDATGLLTTQTFAAAETVCYAAPGQFFKAVVSNGAGTPSINIYVEALNRNSSVAVL